MTNVLLGGPAGQLSGTEIVQDLAACVIEALSNEPELRATNSYQSYSAMISVSLQLNAIDTAIIDTTMHVGNLNASRPADLAVEIESPLAAAEEIRGRMGTLAPSLEHSTIADEETEPLQEPQRRRFYAPRRVTKSHQMIRDKE